MEISSRQNPKVKFIASLKEKKHRQEFGLYLVEGEKSVNEAFTFGAEVVTVLGVNDLVAKYIDKGVEVIVTTKFVADYVCDSKTPQGIVAVVKIPENRLIAPLSNSILLDGIQDPGNMGTIIRTCCACGIKDVYIVDCVDPYAPKTVRASMSGIFSVNIHEGSREQIISTLKNIPIICGDMKGENLFSYTPPAKFCLAVGSEGHGLSQEIREVASRVVSIPMEPTMESLNAGVSASIIMYQLIFKQKGE